MRTFGVYAKRQADSADTDYDFDHSTGIYVLNPEGRVNRQISSDVTPRQLAHLLRKIVVSNQGGAGCLKGLTGKGRRVPCKAVDLVHNRGIGGTP